MTTKLPPSYQDLNNEPGPRILKVGLQTFGVQETQGPGSTAEILRWAKVTGLDRSYTEDGTPWCGLWMAYVALESGWEIPLAPLWAHNWVKFGHPAADRPMLGDVLVFQRPGGGHVGLYVGEDSEAFHVLGGNQTDQVRISRVKRSRLVADRRCPWRIAQPANVRPILRSPLGELSQSEA